MVTLEDLKSKLDTLSPVKIEFVAQLVESLSNSPSADIQTPGTWLTESGDWIEYFGLALSVHHSSTTVPLGLGSFESVFSNACGHVGWPIDGAASTTQRFLDLVVHPTGQPTRRLSLKSTAAKRLSKTQLHISKLTEAAWIQDARTARDRRQMTQSLFLSYQQQVSHIVMLRAFRDDVDSIPSLYQLVEIPTTIFDSIHDATVADFASDAPSFTCLVNGQAAAIVALDRSDAKITVRRIQIDACTIHAEWRQA